MSRLSFEPLSPETLGPSGGWDQVYFDEGSVHLRLGNDDEANDYYFSGALEYTYDEFNEVSLIQGQVRSYSSTWHYHDYDTDGTYYSGGWHINEMAVAAADFLTGGSLELVQEIFSGADTVSGSEGADTLHGFAGQDMLRAGTGRDVLDGGAGEDILFGGLGADTYVVDNVRDVVAEFTGEGIDTVRSSVDYELGANIENLTLFGSAAIDALGNRLANQITGNGAANVLDGGAGRDTLAGGSGSDLYLVPLTAGGLEDVVVEDPTRSGRDTIQVTGSYHFTSAWHIGPRSGVERIDVSGTGATWLDVTGNELDNVLTGNAAANVLDGRAGADALRGGSGADTLVGSTGKDVLTGQGGRDVFAFEATGDSTAAASGQDTVEDFRVDQDQIDLSAIDAKAGATGNQAFTFIGTAAFTAEGQVRYVTSEGSTFVQVNTAGAGGAEMVIRLTGVLDLSAADFIR
jgi:Ca2+-binding RTX toxin-like protein